MFAIIAGVRVDDVMAELADRLQGPGASHVAIEELDLAEILAAALRHPATTLEVARV
ncbi:MAG: hypothetical protein MUF27_11925 [Acidobacteria bacterium]|jgi:hypothetical protein|nr:hypothetical protein [Acidobacteriota bacterium]